jgi:hypothetical protein
LNQAVERSSFRDPSAVVFTASGLVYRQVNQSYARDYDRLMDSGLYERLVHAGLLIPHVEADIDLALSVGAYKVILPEQIPFVSYPFEWSFSQLKAAALVTLEIQKIALAFEMTLKDAASYNIQFIGGKPKLIDTTSFETYEEGVPWVGYGQFCRHFLAPLTVMSCTDIRLQQLMRIHIDGIPLDLATKLLPFTRKFRFSTLMHICMHSWSQKRFGGRSLPERARSGRVSLQSLLGLVQSLESALRRLKWVPKREPWSRYYDEHTYEAADLERKKELVSDFLDKTDGRTVWDLGANTGVFSRIAATKGMRTIAWEADPECVELNYRQVVSRNETNLLPLVVDLSNPSPAIGWENTERASFAERGPVDTILALALIHHLAIAENVPLDRIAEFFARLCKWLIIEFVPKEDPGTQKLMTVRKDVFEDYGKAGFERAFKEYFEILMERRIGDSQRVLYLMSQNFGRYRAAPGNEAGS